VSVPLLMDTTVSPTKQLNRPRCCLAYGLRVDARNRVLHGLEILHGKGHANSVFNSPLKTLGLSTARYMQQKVSFSDQRCIGPRHMSFCVTRYFLRVGNELIRHLGSTMPKIIFGTRIDIFSANAKNAETFILCKLLYRFNRNFAQQ